MSDDVKDRASGPALAGVYGPDRFGRAAERSVRSFGMPRFVIGQTLVVATWVFINSIGFWPRFDPYPFIFLNLVFSALAAYAAPLILLAETRQADRDKTRAETQARDRALADSRLSALMERNAKQTELIARLAEDNRRQPVQIAELLERSRHLLEREGQQTDLLVAALVRDGQRERG